MAWVEHANAGGSVVFSESVLELQSKGFTAVDELGADRALRIRTIEILYTGEGSGSNRVLRLVVVRDGVIVSDYYLPSTVAIGDAADVRVFATVGGFTGLPVVITGTTDWWVPMQPLCLGAGDVLTIAAASGSHGDDGMVVCIHGDYETNASAS